MLVKNQSLVSGACVVIWRSSRSETRCQSHRRRQMSRSALEISRAALRLMVGDGSFNRHLQRMEILTSGDGHLTAELLVKEEDVNRRGTLHGGLATTIVDIMSSLAFLSSRPVDETAFPGVSVDLNVSFLSPVSLGETILVTATTLRQGKSLAFLSVDILNKDKNQMAAIGKHVLAIDRTLPPPLKK